MPWISTLKDKSIPFKGPIKLFDDETVLTLYDPDGLEIELTALESAKYRNENVWNQGPTPEEYAIRGFYSATLSVVPLATFMPSQCQLHVSMVRLLTEEIDASNPV